MLLLALTCYSPAAAGAANLLLLALTCCKPPAAHLQEQVLQQYKEAIAKRLSFTLHLYRGRRSSQTTRKLIVAHFKPAGSEHINSKTPLVGVPGQVAWKSGGEAGHLYFVTVNKDEEADDR